ncbi:unnamed protein product [Adineta steineri]|uniref:Uncharacterized protein n=3 Tax=Adineta steineri TaxID=433720 RepID=A0A813TVR2_9BILA|nr:unnamed protein product [Adineta steineri]
MLKWAVTPRLNSEFSEYDESQEDDTDELLSFQTVIEQHKLPCLVQIVENDTNDSNDDNYYILLCKTNDSYLSVSNETKQFSIPISFDGLFAIVERGVTHYNIVQSIHSLRSHFKSYSSFPYTHFTILQPHMAYSNSSLCRVEPGTLLEPCHSSTGGPSSLTSATGIRLRTLFASLPHSLNKHLLSNQKHSIKKQLSSSSSSSSSNEHFEVKSNLHDEIFTLKSDSLGIFVPVYTQLSSINSQYQLPSSPFSPNHIQGLYTTNVLSKLSNQYPLITELIISRTLEEYASTTVKYPFRRLTFHRLIENHPRIIAFDIKKYAFIEIDVQSSLDMYTIKHNSKLFQHYQEQIRWCRKYLPLFRSQIKTIVHLSDDTTMFFQATQFHQEYQHRRNTSSATCSSVIKHIPKTVYTSHDIVSSNNLHSQNCLASKFYTISNHAKYEQKQRHKEIIRKNARVHFNDSTIERHFQSKHISMNKKHPLYRINNTENEQIHDGEENEDTFQCTAL